MSTENNKKEEEILNNEAEAQVEGNQEVEVKEPTAEEIIQIEKDKYLRLFAEFENYKKRTTRERIELFKTAGQDLMTSLLPVMDDFDRGLAEIKKAKDKELLKGMQLINDKLRKTLEQKGLTLIEVKKGDAFDADIHEAITQIPAPTEKLKGKVIAIELLGNQKHIYVEYNDVELVATFRSDVEVKFNSTIELFLDLDKAYFFEKETGFRIN